MSWFDKLDPKTEIKVGEQYQYEESYHFAGTVTILENLSEKDSKNGSWIGFRVRIDEIDFGGGDRMKVGYDFTCGYREGYEHYGGWVMKPVGSLTEYVFIEGEEDE